MQRRADKHPMTLDTSFPGTKRNEQCAECANCVDRHCHKLQVNGALARIQSLDDRRRKDRNTLDGDVVEAKDESNEQGRYRENSSLDSLRIHFVND